MENQLTQIKRRLHFCMAFIGGCFGAYAILRLGHFASAVTANGLEVLTSATQGMWQNALLRLGAVLTYALTLFLASWLPLRVGHDLRRWSVFLDIAAALFLNFLPDRAGEWVMYGTVFAMGFQWSVFSGPKGYPCATIFSTNNLRQFVDAWVKVRFDHDFTQVPRMELYGKTLLFFHLGGAALCLLWLMGCGARAILLVLLPAVFALRQLTLQQTQPR